MDTLSEIFKDGSYQTFVKIARETKMPDFVKEGSLEEDLSTLGPDTFGDPGNRRYPLNNRSNTWLSREYFERERPVYHTKIAERIHERIQKAAALWGLEPSNRPKANPAEYHVVEAKHGGVAVFRTEIKSAGHWKEAAEYLYANRPRLTYEMRRTFARGLLSAPEGLRGEVEPGLQDYLEKAAGFGMTTDARLMDAIQSRVVHLYRSHPELSAKLLKLAHELREMEYRPATLHKVAGMLDIVDRAVELHRYYGHGHQTPEESVFAVTEKIARALCNEGIRLSTGDVVGRSELMAKRAQVDGFFKNYLGEVPYGTDDEMAQVIASLPRDDSRALLNTVKLTTLRA